MSAPCIDRAARWRVLLPKGKEVIAPTPELVRDVVPEPPITASWYKVVGEDGQYLCGQLTARGAVAVWASRYHPDWLVVLGPGEDLASMLRDAEGSGDPPVQVWCPTCPHPPHVGLCSRRMRRKLHACGCWRSKETP